jgi:hypothetical protein
LGRNASPDEFVGASHMLEEIADELLRIANLEQPEGDAPLTAGDLVREAALRRMRFLGVPARFEEATGCRKACLPACRCTLRSLVLTDEQFVASLASKLQSQQLEARVDALREKLGGRYNVGFSAGGGEFLFPGQPGPMEDIDAEDDAADA